MHFPLIVVSIFLKINLFQSFTTVVAVFPNLCLWRRSLCSNLGGIDPEKLYRATLTQVQSKPVNADSEGTRERVRVLTGCPY